MNAVLLPSHSSGHSATDASPRLTPSGGSVHGPQSGEATGAAGLSLDGGRIALDPGVLKRLRMARLMSQQDLADDCWRRNIQISLTTIKRAEGGRAVRFRIAREFARCFDVPIASLLEG